MLENITIKNQADASYPASIDKKTGLRSGSFSFILVADSDGKASVSVSGVDGWLVDWRVKSEADVAPTASWDLYLADGWGNILDSNTAIPATGNPAYAADLGMVAPGTLVFTAAGMGSGGKARVTVTVSD